METQKHELSEDAVKLIKQLLREGILQKHIAMGFGVSPSLISQIHKGKVWAHVE